MTQEHPITPSIELVKQWSDHWHRADDNDFDHALFISIRAARWGADQELKACCLWADITGWKGAGKSLQLVRRPKPPSLKEEALETLLSMQIQPCVINGINTNADLMAKYDILRRALESLPD